VTVPHRFPPSWNLEEDKRDEAGGATPGLLRLTMDGYLTAHWEATPLIKIVRTMWVRLWHL